MYSLGTVFVISDNLYQNDPVLTAEQSLNDNIVNIMTMSSAIGIYASQIYYDFKSQYNRIRSRLYSSERWARGGE